MEFEILPSTMRQIVEDFCQSAPYDIMHVFDFVPFAEDHLGHPLSVNKAARMLRMAGVPSIKFRYYREGDETRTSARAWIVRDHEIWEHATEKQLAEYASHCCDRDERPGKFAKKQREVAQRMIVRKIQDKEAIDWMDSLDDIL